MLTDFLNPVLDRCGFWRALEFLIYFSFGMAKRDDDKLLALVLAEDPRFLGDPADAGERS